MNLIQQTASLTDVPPRAAATIAGLSLLAMVMLAPFANFYVMDKLVVAKDAKATADNIVAASGLFRMGIACFLVVAVLDVIVAWALHVLLEPVNKHLSLLAAFFRVAYAAVFVSALVPLLGVVRLLSGGGRSTGLEGDQLHSQVTWALGAFNAGWGLGLVLFGVHLLALGAVLFKSGFIPKWLAVLVGIAGAGYLVDGFVNVLMPDVNLKLALFTFVGEVLLIFWLLWHGIKGTDQRRSPRPLEA